jgi:hypothetical protein
MSLKTELLRHGATGLNKPVPATKRKPESSHFPQLQLHLAREPRTPIDRGNRIFFIRTCGGVPGRVLSEVERRAAYVSEVATVGDSWDMTVWEWVK